MCAGGNLTGLLDSFRANPNPAINTLVPWTGNLTWDLLKRIPSLDDQSRELVMNMVGTVIYYPASSSLEQQHIPPTIKSIKDLLYGQGATGTNITVDFWVCDDYDVCDEPTLRTINIEPMTTKVERALRSISDHISTRTPIPNNSAEIALVNNTSLPIYRILSVGNTIPNTGLPYTLISKYRDVIASDYTAGFMMQFSAAALSALRKKGQLSAEQQKDLSDLHADVKRMREEIATENIAAYRKLGAVSDVVGEMERLERSLRSNMSANLLDMLAYSNRRTQ